MLQRFCAVALLLAVLFSLLLALPLGAAEPEERIEKPLSALSSAATIAGSITVYDTVLGKTTSYIGATEAGVFWIDDLVDLGINTYRMWTKMDELEWWDDDDAQAGYLCTGIGTPTIAQIMADQASGFANTIPWAWWDQQFTGTYYQWSGKSREQVIAQCVASGIAPVLVLRNKDNFGRPNYCSGAWAPDAPITAADLNEWWEHCFAIAYWLNVRHSYGVTRFEVLNEPDLYGQGWHGTQAEYVQMVQTAYDAVRFANDIAGVDTVIYAPVVSNHGSAYIANALDNADAQIAAVDYHNYDNDPTASIQAVKATIAAHNPDGVTEPIWVSEWGTYTGSYNDLDRAILTAQQLLTFSEQALDGVALFGMYDWGSFSGLLDTSRNRSESYYAYRLTIRGLVGAKDRLSFTTSGMGGRTMVTRGGGKVYVLVVDGNATVEADLTSLGVRIGSVTVYEYSSTHKDQVVDAPVLSGGRFTFTAPLRGVVLAEVQPAANADLAVHKTMQPDIVRLGDVVTCTVYYTNGGPGQAVGVYVTDTLPAGTSPAGGHVSASPGWTGPNVSGQTVSWYTPTLDAGASGQFVFTATVDLLAPVSADWVLTDTAEITCSNDITGTDNAAAASSVLQGLEIRKAHWPEPVTAAWNFWYYIDVTNTASSPATNLVITDALPAGVAPYSVQADLGGVFDGVNTVVWTIPSLGPNAMIRVSIKARTYSNQGGKCLPNRAWGDSDQAAPPVTASDVMCVVAGPPVTPTATPTATPTPQPGTVLPIQGGVGNDNPDTYIYRYAANINYALQPSLKVGYKQTHAALLRFDVSAVPAGAIVDDAWLEVYAVGWSGPGADITLSAYAISTSVQISETTWNEATDGGFWTEPGCESTEWDRRSTPESVVTTTGPGKWYRFDLTALVQQWLDGALPNNGVLLRQDAYSPFTFFFASSEYPDATLRPKLTTRYH